MAGKYLRQFLVLGVVLAILIVWMAFSGELIAVPEVMVILLIFSGFIPSFFIRENTLLGYARQAVIFSSLFSILLIAALGVQLYFIDERFWRGHGIFDMITIFIIFFSFLSFLNLVGSLIGIIPKAIAERMISR